MNPLFVWLAKGIPSYIEANTFYYPISDSSLGQFFPARRISCIELMRHKLRFHAHFDGYENSTRQQKAAVHRHGPSHRAIFEAISGQNDANRVHGCFCSRPVLEASLHAMECL